MHEERVHDQVQAPGNTHVLNVQMVATHSKIQVLRKTCNERHAKRRLCDYSLYAYCTPALSVTVTVVPACVPDQYIAWRFYRKASLVSRAWLIKL